MQKYYALTHSMKGHGVLGLSPGQCYALRGSRKKYIIFRITLSIVHQECSYFLSWIQDNCAQKVSALYVDQHINADSYKMCCVGHAKPVNYI